MVPENPKIYHIVHVDRLASIIADGHLWSDATMTARQGVGTTIGMSNIKQRRLNLPLNSHPDLHVGACVPFYLCPRSVMLYLLFKANDRDLGYRGGQEPIVHLMADLKQTADWAEAHGQRWAFTTTNAGSRFFDDYTNLAQLDQVDWSAVKATYWMGQKDGKQAEFLVERQFPWHLISGVGVY